MPETSEYREKFLDAEKKASDLVNQLEALKNESVNYKNAKDNLSDVTIKIANLISKFSGIVSEEENLINAIREIGTEKIVEMIRQNKITFEEKISAQEKHISKLFTFFYITIGLVAVTGVLVIIFR